MFFLQFSFCPLAFDLWLLLSGHFSLHWIWESEVVEINIRHFKAIYAVFCLIHITNGGSNLTFFSQSWSPPQEVIYLKHPNPSPVQQNTTKITHPSHLWILKNVFFLINFRSTTLILGFLRAKTMIRLFCYVGIWQMTSILNKASQRSSCYDNCWYGKLILFLGIHDMLDVEIWSGPPTNTHV